MRPVTFLGGRVEMSPKTQGAAGCPWVFPIWSTDPVRQLNTSVGLIRDTDLCLHLCQMQPMMLGKLGSGPGQEKAFSNSTDIQSYLWQGQ